MRIGSVFGRWELFGEEIKVIDRRSGLATLPLLGTAAALLLATTAMAQQGPGVGQPHPDRSTPVQANELRETWNDRVSAGPP